MSSRRARRPMPVAGPSEAYATHVAVVDDRLVTADVEYARQATHDYLIEQLGDTRRSGIWWTHHPAASGVKAFNDLCSELPQHAEDAEVIRRLRQGPRTLLVIAWVLAEMPEGARF